MPHITGKATTVAITNAGSAQSAALPSGVYTITCDVAAYVEQGANPTATAPSGGVGSFMLPANVVVKINVADTEKIAARCVTAASGTLWIHPGA